ncbi:MAG: hypothetical protein QM682_14795 [Paracoccus sp. (in: a-proteobacteria)]|uniref:hypothetical protein n=1 Tax=Paracoccus sp. TaxID=267 RepID=UPI0039E5BFA9
MQRHGAIPSGRAGLSGRAYHAFCRLLDQPPLARGQRRGADRERRSGLRRGLVTFNAFTALVQMRLDMPLFPAAELIVVMVQLRLDRNIGFGFAATWDLIGIAGASSPPIRSLPSR